MAAPAIPTMRFRGMQFSMRYEGIEGGGLVNYTITIIHKGRSVSLPTLTTTQKLAREFGVTRFHETGRKHAETNEIPERSLITFHCESMIQPEHRAAFLAAIAINVRPRTRQRPKKQRSRADS